jgi:uncharacterized protein involved in exopolysaccharide biosynthesis
MNSKLGNIQMEEELDLLAIVKYFWNYKMRITLIVFLFFVLGLIYASLLPEMFTSSSTFVPQTADASKSVNSLGNLASLAGVNLPSVGSNAEIPAALYPQILSATTFKKDLLNAPLYLEGWDKPVTYSTYYEQIVQDDFLTIVKKYTVGLPKTVLMSFRSEEEIVEVKQNQEIVSITNREYQHFKRLEKQMSISPNNKEGFITLSFTMPDAHLSAQMAKFSQELLQKELIAYKVSNAREQLVFSEKNYAEKKLELQTAQKNLADYRDKNQHLVSASIQSEIRALEAEYNFAFSIFTDIAKQLEQAKLQVSKDTPVFTIIQPVTVPYEKSSPNKPIIVILFTFVGGLIAILYLMYLGGVQYLQSNWKNIHLR